MRLLARTVAALTVAGAIVLVSPFSRLAGIRDMVEPPPVLAAPTAFELPDDWSSSVLRHLERRNLRIEVAELEGLIRAVDANARRFRLDPLMVLAVIHVESGFDPFAVSPAGAAGLMQLQADTARDLASRLSIPWTSDDLRFEPETNILLGACYLRELLDRFGDSDLALAAFHSGPNRIAAQKLQPGPASLVYADRVRSTLLELQASARV